MSIHTAHRSNAYHPAGRVIFRPIICGLGILIFFLALGAIYKIQFADNGIFHCLVSIFGIIFASGIGVLGWNAHRYFPGYFFAILAVAYMSAALCELVHLLSCPQVFAFRPINSHIAEKAGTAGLLLTSLSLVMAPLFHYRDQPKSKRLFLYSFIFMAIIAALFAWPGLYQGNLGSVATLIYSSWHHFLTAIIFGIAMILLFVNGRTMESSIRGLLIVACGMAMAAQVVFGLYGKTHSGFYLMGDYLKLGSFYMLLMVMIDAGLVKPFTLFDTLRRKKQFISSWSPTEDRTINDRNEYRTVGRPVSIQSILDGIAEPIVIIDDQIQVIYANRAANQSSHSPVRATNSDYCHPLLCGGSISCDDCSLGKRVAEKRRQSFERACGSDDKCKEKVELIPLTDHEDGFIGTMIRIMDLTASKQLERHLIHSEKMSTLGLLVSGIVHEISNPNNFITFNIPILRTYLQKLLDEWQHNPDTKTKKDWFGMDYAEFRLEVFSLLENLAHGAERIGNIVSNLKEVTHPRLVDRTRMQADLQDVIGKAVTLCRNEVSKHVKVFKVESSPEPIWLHATPEGLEQVLINLIINAAQAADKQDSWIELKTHIHKETYDSAVIEISDNGCGIDEQNMDRLFDPFFTTKEPGAGTGLGLSISRNLIRQMGGCIKVRSLPGQRTVFAIHLPLCQASDPHSETRRMECQHAEPSSEIN